MYINKLVCQKLEITSKSCLCFLSALDDRKLKCHDRVVSDSVLQDCVNSKLECIAFGHS